MNVFRLAAALLLVTSVPLGAQRTLLHVGTLLDGTGAEPRTEKTVVIAEGRIAGIEDGYSRPAADDTVIDLRDQTVLPGLMDLHVHLTSESSPRSYAERFSLNPADGALRGVVYAHRTLMAGFTTVRDVGGAPTAIVALRNAIDQGLIQGPKVYASAGGLASTGGHGDPTNGLSAALRGDPGPAVGVVNGVDDARKAVRQRYKEGADLIKITATGGVLSLAKSGQNPQFTIEEIEAIVETAADYGFHVAAHAHGTEGIKRAVLGGVRTIEHGTFMDEEAMKLMKERGTWWVPTISAGQFVAEKAEVEGYYPDIIRPKARAIGPRIVDTFARAYRAGVPIAFGTDCGVCPHGSNAREFEHMVEAGMKPLEAITSATLSTAKVLGIEDQTGTLEVGKEADIIAVSGDPLRDVRVLQEVGFVMKDGVVVKRDGAAVR